MKIVCLLAIGLLFAETNSNPDPVGDLINAVIVQKHINDIVDAAIVKIHKIVDDAVESVENEFKTTQSNIAGFYQTAGSLKGNLDKAYADENTELTKFETDTEKKIQDAVVAVRAAIKEAIDEIVVYSKSQNCPQATVDSCVKNVNDTIEETIKNIEQTAKDFYKDANDEAAASHARQNALRTQAAGCTGSACVPYDTLWKQVLKSSADQLKRLLDKAVSDIQREVNVGVAKVKAQINPIVLAIQYVLGVVGFVVQKLL